MQLLDVQLPNHSNTNQPEPLNAEATLPQANAFTGFSHPLPVSNELIPEVLYSYSSPISSERRTDIILKDLIVKIYSSTESKMNDQQAPSTQFLAIVVTKADRKNQIIIEIEALNPVHTFGFRYNGDRLDGTGYGDLEMALISEMLPERIPADRKNSLPQSVTNLLYSLVRHQSTN